MTTIVSGFISNINTNKSLESYINYGKKLINIPVKKIIFIEDHIYNDHLSEYINEEILMHTVFCFIKKNDIYLYKYYDKITNFDLYTDTPNKDTIDYMITMCNKTEFVKSAIELNPHNTDQFIWVDFGIYHIFNHDHIANHDELFINYIQNLSQKIIENEFIIRIAGGYFYIDVNLYHEICWCFLGGIFGGHKNALLEFANLMNKKCISVIENEKTILWEVNMWYMIYKDHPELFSIYITDHNPNMIHLY